jgi:hypothetical protein
MRQITERKGTKPRIGSATVSGTAPKFTPSAQEWVKIEQAYDREFTEESRSDICKIVDNYLDWRRFEKEAPLVDDVISQIESIEKRARALNRGFSILFDRSGTDTEAAFHAQTRIEHAWRGADRLGPQKLTALHTMTCTLVSACIRAAKTLEHQAKPWEGQAWELMVNRLILFADSHGLSVRIRKDSARQAEVKHSPLVSFVKAIQDQFPPEIPIRFSTEDSLALAINRVRRNMKEHGIDLGR